MAVGDDKITDFTVDNYAALKLKHPQRDTCCVLAPQMSTVLYPRSFSSTRLFSPSPTALVQSWMVFRPKCVNDLTAKSNEQTGFNYLRGAINLVNVILGGKVPFELWPYFFGAILFALNNRKNS